MTDDLGPRVAGETTIRTTRSLADALPWPLSLVATILAGDRLEAIKHATRPNPYTTSPSGAQATIAAHQAQHNALIGGMDGLAGSSRAWDGDQGRSSLVGRAPGMLEQDLSSQSIPPSRMVPYTRQGHPRDLNTTRGYTGPVITPSRLNWGWSTRFRYPRILAGTLLPPEARTPSAREMARGFVESNPRQLRVDDPFLGRDDMEDW